MKGLFLLATLFIALPSHAQLFHPQGQKEWDNGLRELYNLDYDQARQTLDRLIELEPDNPFSYLGQSGVLWWQASSEYGLFKDTPTLEGVFENDIKMAQSKGEEQLKEAEASGDRQAQASANFVVGMALGTRGQWKLLRGHWLGAYFDGKHAVQHLNRCIELEPEFYDAYIGLGLYDYETDRLPKFLKLSALLFVRGNAKRGLERLELARERARYTPSYAGEYLASIYLADLNDPRKALPLIDDLISKYPQSLYFRFIDALALAQLKDPAAFEKAKELEAEARKDPAFYGRKQLTLWCGLYGDKCLTKKGIRDADAWLTQALEWRQEFAPSTWSEALHFFRGVARDLQKRREPALEDYRAALVGPPSPVKALAQHCLDEVCDREEVLAQLKSMSLQPVGEPMHIPRKPVSASPDPNSEQQ